MSFQSRNADKIQILSIACLIVSLAAFQFALHGFLSFFGQNNPPTDHLDQLGALEAFKGAEHLGFLRLAFLGKPPHATCEVGD